MRHIWWWAQSSPDKTRTVIIMTGWSRMKCCLLVLPLSVQSLKLLQVSPKFSNLCSESSNFCAVFLSMCPVSLNLRHLLHWPGMFCLGLGIWRGMQAGLMWWCCSAKISFLPAQAWCWLESSFTHAPWDQLSSFCLDLGSFPWSVWCMDSHMSDPILNVHICSNHVSAFFIDSSWEQIVIRFSELSPTRFLFVSDPHLAILVKV